jgi:hypothetical protein
MKSMFATEDGNCSKTCISRMVRCAWATASWAFACLLIFCVLTEVSRGGENEKGKAEKSHQKEAEQAAVESASQDTEEKVLAFIGGDIFTCAPGTKGAEADYENGVIIVCDGRISEVG